MSGGLNKCAFIGNLGADPELKFAQAGGAILRMRLAVNESWKDKDGAKQERTEWITLVMFGTRAEGVEKHLHKGSRIYAEGRMQTRTWDDKDGNKRYATEVVVNDLVFLDGKRDGGERQPREQRRTTDTRGGGGDAPPDDFGSDDIPFLTSEVVGWGDRPPYWRARVR
jgi:single-strand DNA-binding protein